MPNVPSTPRAVTTQIPKDGVVFMRSPRRSVTPWRPLPVNKVDDAQCAGVWHDLAMLVPARLAIGNSSASLAGITNQSQSPRACVVSDWIVTNLSDRGSSTPCTHNRSQRRRPECALPQQPEPTPLSSHPTFGRRWSSSKDDLEDRELHLRQVRECSRGRKYSISGAVVGNLHVVDTRAAVRSAASADDDSVHQRNCKLAIRKSGRWAKTHHHNTLRESGVGSIRGADVRVRVYTRGNGIRWNQRDGLFGREIRRHEKIHAHDRDGTSARGPSAAVSTRLATWHANAMNRQPTAAIIRTRDHLVRTNVPSLIRGRTRCQVGCSLARPFPRGSAATGPNVTTPGATEVAPGVAVAPPWLEPGRF